MGKDLPLEVGGEECIALRSRHSFHRGGLASIWLNPLSGAVVPFCFVTVRF